MLFKLLASLLLLLSPFCLEALPGYWEPWGKDADLKVATDSPSASLVKPSPLSRVAEKVILFHQNVISPVDGPRSHFRPTSSRYMLLAIRRYGFWKGFMMGCDRLLRENDDPWVYRTIEIDGVQYKWDPP